MKKKSDQSKHRENIFIVLAIIIGVSLFAYVLPETEFFTLLELKIYDLAFQFRGPRPFVDGGDGSEESSVVVVAIDQETADSLSFPFDRRHYGTVIQKLTKLGARRIVYDIDFSSTSNNPESDSLLYAAIEECGNVVLTGNIEYKYHKGLKEPLKEIRPPAPQISPPGTPFGLVNDLVDPDGVNRRYPLFFSTRDTTYLTLAFKTLAVERGVTSKLDSVHVNYFRYAGADVPLFTDVNSTLLNYYGPAGTFPTYSFIHVLRGEYDFEDILEGLTEEEIQQLQEAGMLDMLSDNPFKDKIVLIGASDEYLQDNKYTPFFSKVNPLKTPGVEVHANALSMFMTNTYLKMVNFNWIIFGIIVLSVLMFVLGKYLPQWLAVSIVIILVLGTMLASAVLFMKADLWLKVIPWLMTITLGYPSNLIYRFILSQNEKAMIKGMFSQYVSKKVTEELIANPGLLKLGGEKRRMSVLFTDVAGFTTVSEKLTPEELVALLNEYLTAMSNVIFEHEGIVDKYEGDLIMAEFGAPLWYEDHAARCCRASLEMQRRLQAMRRRWRAAGKIALYSRIGINSGDMIVGNMGSEQLFDYTVMGDAVNLSSRLEGANKAYGSTIMMGQETYKEIQGQFVTRPLDFLRVKGKTEPIQVYELLAEKLDELSPQKQQAIKLYEQGLEMYRKRDFVGAQAKFKEALESDDKDGPSKVYHDRCALYLANPPEPDWDGVWELHEK